MSIAKEFREFAVKGNVVDMAVGIIIGAAFGKIVSSLVSDVVTPPLGYVIGGVDFTKLAVTMPALREGAEAGHAPLRRVPAGAVRFHHRRVRDLHDREAASTACAAKKRRSRPRRPRRRGRKCCWKRSAIC